MRTARIFGLAAWAVALSGCGADGAFPTPGGAASGKTDAGPAILDSAASHPDASAQADAGALDAGTGGGQGGDVLADGVTDAQGRATPDTQGVSDSGGQGDGAGSIDAGQSCACQPGELWLHGPCVPTFALGCAAVKTCKPGGCPGASEGKEVCDQTAASPTCAASSLLPVCVPGPGMGFAPGSLRLSATQATTGESIKLTVDGGMFYIGALFWLIRIGDETIGPVNEGATCSISTTWTPKASGVVPVLAYYGEEGKGGPGGELAGFVAVDGPDPGRQPGQTCSASQPCAQAAPWSCTCVQGRCGCKKP